METQALHVALSPNGKLLVTASGGSTGTVKLWDVARCQEFATLPHPKQITRCVAFSPDSRMVATGGGSPKDGKIWLWETASGKLRANLNGHKQTVISVAWSGDATLLASASDDKTIKFWDAKTGKETVSLHGRARSVDSVVAFTLTARC